MLKLTTTPPGAHTGARTHTYILFGFLIVIIPRARRLIRLWRTRVFTAAQTCMDSVRPTRLYVMILVSVIYLCFFFFNNVHDFHVRGRYFIVCVVPPPSTLSYAFSRLVSFSPHPTIQKIIKNPRGRPIGMKKKSQS